MQRFVKYPPQITLLFILLMILISSLTATLNIETPWLNIFAGFILLTSISIIVFAVLSFRRVSTTIDASIPEQSSCLVKTGIYGYSRNPMYLGFFGFLVGTICLLGNFLNVLLLPIYISYMNKRFIESEEQALTVIFETSFIDYKKQVRRWI